MKRNDLNFMSHYRVICKHLLRPVHEITKSQTSSVDKILALVYKANIEKKPIAQYCLLSNICCLRGYSN